MNRRARVAKVTCPQQRATTKMTALTNTRHALKMPLLCSFACRGPVCSNVVKSSNVPLQSTKSVVWCYTDFPRGSAACMLLKRERVIAQQRVCCHADERWRSAALHVPWLSHVYTAHSIVHSNRVLSALSSSCKILTGYGPRMPFTAGITQFLWNDETPSELQLRHKIQTPSKIIL